MNCDRCDASNPAGSKFCNQCGAVLGVACPHCHFTNPAGLLVCTRCRSSLPAGLPSSKGGGKSAERRQISVMFAALVGSAALARELDAEDLRDVVSEYQALAELVVAELGGHVAQYLNDGVMVYFGYPEAHEDDPQRAILAALRLVERVGAPNGRLYQLLPTPPHVRVGIHTGIVVVDNVGGGRERLALGDVPNLAARLEELAAPDAVLVSSTTRKLLGGFFRVVPRGNETIKGFAEPVAVHQVLGTTGVSNRVTAAGARLTPFAGRDEEAAELAKQWHAVARERSFRVIVLCGEAGIGKSRQTQAFKASLAGTFELVEASCSSLQQNTAFWPIARALEAKLNLQALADPADPLRRLEEYARELGLASDAVALLATLLSLPLPEEVAARVLTGSRRERTMQALGAWLRALSRSGPALFVLEDIHWADPSTLEFLTTYIAAADPNQPLMLLATRRPEFEPAWRSPARVDLVLQRLPRRIAEQMIRSISGGRSLPREAVERVLGLTDGVPLYLEEVTKAVLESGALELVAERYELSRSLPEGIVPATVHDSLTARLDRLGESKSLIQLAATLGREFPHELLRSVALLDEETLHTSLEQLLESGLLFAEENAGTLHYRFKHALIQEAAYQSLLSPQLQRYHQRIAGVLAERFPLVAEEQPGLVARHEARANLPERAAKNFERAGDRAFSAQAYVEASNHFRSSLEQLHKLPASTERDRRELYVLTALGLPLLMTKSYSAPEVQQTYNRALELCAEVDPPLRILFGLWAIQIMGGNLTTTGRMVSQFRRIADAGPNSSEKFIALAAIGSHAFWAGAFDDAIPALEKAVSHFEPGMLTTLPRDYGYDNALYGHIYLAWSQYMAGRLSSGKTTWEKLRSLTESAQSPYLTAMTLALGSSFTRILGDVEGTFELADRCVTLTSEHQLQLWLENGYLRRGWALCHLAKFEQGLAEIEHSLQFFRGLGAITSIPYCLSCLAEGCLLAGELERGLNAVDEGLKLGERYLGNLCAAELLRLKGELLSRSARDDLAEACFRKSLDVAERGSGRLWQLHTAVSFATWLRRRGQPDQALAILEAACRGIVGEDAPIFRTARALKLELTECRAN